MAPAANTAMADKEVIIRFIMGSLLFLLFLVEIGLPNRSTSHVLTHSLAKSREERVRLKGGFGDDEGADIPQYLK
jgi:hypothetical protein